MVNKKQDKIKVENIVTEKDFFKGLEEEIPRLTNYLEKTEYPITALEYLICYLVWSSKLTHYERLGVLEEIKFRIRDEFLKEVEE